MLDECRRRTPATLISCHALVSDPPQWLLYAVVVVSLIVLSAVSGIGTAWLARMAKNNPRAHADSG